MRIGLLLIPGFPLMAYASLVEAFRAANALSGRTLYEWQHIAAGGEIAQASNGARILADRGTGGALDARRLFVIAGGNPRAFDDRPLFAWLRLLARQGMTLGGISGGPYLLARAGLLAGRRATIHWEHLPALAADFPEVRLESRLSVIDGPIITCAGGTAGLDLALELIAQDWGAALAEKVGEWFIRTTARDAAAPQRQSAAERHGTTNPAVLRALALIEQHLDQPPERSELARVAGVSLRHLERLFMRHLNCSLSDAAMAIRLDQAAHLLRSTDEAVTAIALECGFTSAAHFSRRFSARFGHPPSAFRKPDQSAPASSKASAGTI